VSSADRGDDGAEVVGAAVVQGVVGHDLADDDAVLGEERGCVGEEPGAGGPLLVGQDLCKRDPGVVVDRDVDVVEPDPAGALAASSVVVDDVGSVQAPAAAVGDATEFLHVDVDQVSGPVALISALGPS
jgi:hypothetical protein